MKKMIKILFAISVPALIFISCGNGMPGGKDWAVKIDDQIITIEEFNRLYYIQNKLALNLEKNEDVDKLAADPSSLRPEIQQSVIKKSFMENLIAQKLLYKKAMGDKNLDRQELDTIIEISKLQLVGQYYLNKILKDEINVTQNEIDKFYKANIDRFRQMPINEADFQIKRYLSLQKFKEKSNDYVMSLVGESTVNKKGFYDNEKKLSSKKDEQKKDEIKNTEKDKSTPDKTKEPEKK